jgi:outer membrane protein assembly factor BamB
MRALSTGEDAESASAEPPIGEDLASIVDRDGPLEPGRALDLCSQIGGALDAARAGGLVRRPLEAADVLVTAEDGREVCRLGGFRLDEPGTAEPDVRALSDILFHCLTGRPPADGEDRRSVWLERPELPEAIDDVLDDTARYGTCGAFCDATRKALGLAVPGWRSRKALLVAAVLVAAALAAGLALWLTRAEGEPAAAEKQQAFVPLGPGALVRIDAATGEVVARVPVMYPSALATDGRSVWSLSDAGTMRQKLVHVEPATNTVTRSVGADASVEWPTRLAVAGGSVWLGTMSGQVYRLAPAASTAEPVQWNTSALVAAAGSLWVSSYPAGPCCTPPPDLYRIDPATGRTIARIRDAETVVAAGPGFVWALVSDHPEADPPGFYVRIDTETHEKVPIGRLGFRPADFTVADGAVWASSPNDDAIVRLDPETGQETDRVRIGRSPRRMATAAGAVWAAIGKDGTVARYDIAGKKVLTIDVGGTPKDLIVVGDSVWVAVQEN